MKDIQQLNQKYSLLNIDQRLQKFYKDFANKEIIMTSAFNTTSVILLNHLKNLNFKQDIYFLDTGYHFIETLQYKDLLIKNLNLNVITLKAEDWKHLFTQEDQTYLKNPDFCCAINKTEPLNEIKQKADIWISGIMKWQNNYRETIDIFEQKDGILKFHPIIDLTEKEASIYIESQNLPQHPLFVQGYYSVGCIHCTQKGQKREGRWAGKSKTECGLHL